MEIDGETISQGCQTNTKCNVKNKLCRTELNVVLEQLEYSKKNNKNLLINSDNNLKDDSIKFQQNIIKIKNISNNLKNLL
mgnify:CR=1 FL=1